MLNRHADTKLQTRLTSAGLQKRLLDLYADARTLEEEQGVNILYLALGTLRWVDPANAEAPRFAPLILVPVSLERGSAAERFKLRWRQEEPAPNLSLEAFLERVHALRMPSFEPGDEFNPSSYMDAVAEAVRLKEGWEVAPDDIVLGFFSFAKFLMYRDLDPELWPQDGKLTALPLIRGLMAEGFPQPESMVAEDVRIDGLIPPHEMCHIVDSDSSQAMAIHDIRRGRDLVIQGPPGTGKSQTIANVIGAAVADGHTVLFVAEKMAALEVVKRRLDQAGVGDACLELHSNKANKRQLLDELRRTWELGSPRGEFPDTLMSRLERSRDALNGHVDRMHRVHAASGLTPYQVLGELVRLREEGCPVADLTLEAAESWRPAGREERAVLIDELARRVEEIGRPTSHPWWGVGLDMVLPMQVERLAGRIAGLRVRLEEIGREQKELSALLDVPVRMLEDAERLAAAAQRVATAPERCGPELGAAEWETRDADITALVDRGGRYAALVHELMEKVHPAAWPADVGAVRGTLAALPPGTDQEALTRMSRLSRLLPDLIRAAEEVRALLGLDASRLSLEEADRIRTIGKAVAGAPDVAPEIYVSAVWDEEPGQIEDLVDAVATVQKTRSLIGNRVAEAAWDMDAIPLRRILASHGTSLLRYLSGEWRQAQRLIRSLLPSPDLPLDEVLTLLDQLIAGQKAVAAVRAGEALGKRAFGRQWRGEKSKVEEIAALRDWMNCLGAAAAEIRAIAARTADRRELASVSQRLDMFFLEVKPLLAAGRAELASAEGLLPVLLDWCRAVGAADAASRAWLTFVPSRTGESVQWLERLEEAQRLLRAIEAAEGLGLACFGASWRGPQTSWPECAETAGWVRENRDIRAIAGRLTDRRETARRAVQAAAAVRSLMGDLAEVLRDLRTDAPRLFGTAGLKEVTPEALGLKLDTWLANPEQLSKWVVFRDRAEKARSLGMGSLVDRLEDGRLAPAEIGATFRQAYYEAILADQVQQDPELARFDGQVHGRLVREFAELDQQQMAAARLAVVRAHHRRIPQPGGGGVGPVGVLRSEIGKRRGHLPIRQLMTKAAPAVQALKPVLMMSPLSVAQFLPPGQLTFDLLVMDEASQIQPVDALGAIARCRRVVVVGDECQLPPTRFFARMTGAQLDDEDGEAAEVADMESILGLFTARGLPQRMLRWHYRSRHQSLIAVSNSQFYDSKLFIVPSPYTSEAGMGLRFHHIRDGWFDSGNTRVNVVEAKRVAEAAIRHALEHPELSLGIATFSASQSRAIRDQIELLRRANPSAEAFFQGHPSEPFFVKNLENVQGDERDVIFISVGYGKNQQGYMAMVFGPLSAEGGERRLNVLISRAKRRCEVFSSITDEDIDTERAKGKGVFAFKLFLHFARTGRLSMAHRTERDFDSVFESQVANALTARGYRVHPQVGIAGFFIDLAIDDPEQPGRYLLGIECDGATYHSARSARDRDRLRQEVLEDHGWIIHRIWSTDWFQRPREQTDRVVAAIEAARAELAARGEKRLPHAGRARLEVVTVEREESTEIGLAEVEGSRSRTIYVEAAPARPSASVELYEMPVDVLAGLVAEIVSVEGPVHSDEVTTRVRCVWGLQRSGARLQGLVDLAVQMAVEKGSVIRREPFLWAPGQTVQVRDRSAVASLALRKAEMLPPEEIQEAVLQIVRLHLGADRDGITLAVLKLFGFKSTSAALREAVQAAVRVLIDEGKLAVDGERLAMAKSEGADRLTAGQS